MTATVHYMTKTHNRAVVKIVGTAAADTATIDITSDLVVAGQTASSPKVGISGLAYSVSSSGDVTVSRNLVPVFKLFGHDTLQYGSNEQATQNIVVTFNTSAGGTLILELSKTSGFSAVNPPEVLS
jgi:hypothetical protein